MEETFRGEPFHAEFDFLLDVLDEIFIDVNEPIDPIQPKEPVYDELSDPWGGH